MTKIASPLCTRRVLLAAAALTGVAGASLSAMAQVTLDMSKITCEQYLTFKVANPEDISIWLSGYFHGVKGDRVLETQRLKENFDALKNACFLRENLKRSVFGVAEEQFGKQK